MQGLEGGLCRDCGSLTLSAGSGRRGFWRRAVSENKDASFNLSFLPPVDIYLLSASSASDPENVASASVGFTVSCRGQMSCPNRRKNSFPIEVTVARENTDRVLRMPRKLKVD